MRCSRTARRWRSAAATARHWRGCSPTTAWCAARPATSPRPCSTSTEATRLAQESDDVGLQVGVLVTMMIWQLHRGELREARGARRSGPRADARHAERGQRRWSASVRSVFGTFYRGVDSSDRRGPRRCAPGFRPGDRAGARRHGDLEVVAMALGFYALLGWFSGDATIGLRHARQAVELAEKIGSPMVRAQAYGFLGIAHVQREEWNAAIAALQTRAGDRARAPHAAVRRSGHAGHAGTRPSGPRRAGAGPRRRPTRPWPWDASAARGYSNATRT